MKRFQFFIPAACLVALALFAIWLAFRDDGRPRIDGYDLLTGEAIRVRADGTQLRLPGFSMYYPKRKEGAAPGVYIGMEEIGKQPALRQLIAIFDSAEYDVVEKSMLARMLIGCYRKKHFDDQLLIITLGVIKGEHQENVMAAKERATWPAVPDFILADYTPALTGRYQLDLLQAAQDHAETIPYKTRIQTLLPDAIKDKVRPRAWHSDRLVLDFANGNLIALTAEKVVYKSGVNGFFRETQYPTGAKCTQRTILTFEGDHTRVEQFLDGKLYCRGTFIRGEAVPDDNPFSQSAFSECRGFSADVPDGKFECFYSNGQLNSETTFERGKICGIGYSYSDTGQVRGITDHRDPETVSTQSYHLFSDGTTKPAEYHVLWRQGRGNPEMPFGPKESHEFTYYPDGTVQTELIIRIGMAGRQYKFHPNGKLQLDQPIWSQHRQGESYEYDPDGNLIDEAMWQNDQLNGEERRYSADGELQETTQWLNYKKHGIHRKNIVRDTGTSAGRPKEIFVNQEITPYEFDVPHGTGKVMRGDIVLEQVDYFMGVKHGISEKFPWPPGNSSPPIRELYYYGTELQENREPERRKSLQTGLSTYLGTPYRDMIVLRTLQERLGKDVPELRDEFGFLYFDCRPGNPTPEAWVALNTTRPDCGFFLTDQSGSRDAPTDWQTRDVVQKLPFPERANVSPSPWYFYLRNCGRLYLVTLDRQWTLPRTPDGTFRASIELQEITVP